MDIKEIADVDDKMKKIHNVIHQCESLQKMYHLEQIDEAVICDMALYRIKSLLADHPNVR